MSHIETDEGFIRIERLSNLTSLDVSKSTNIRDECLSNISSLTKLKSLDISYSNNTTNDGFSKHLLSLTNLTSLNIEGTWDLVGECMILFVFLKI